MKFRAIIVRIALYPLLSCFLSITACILNRHSSTQYDHCVKEPKLNHLRSGRHLCSGRRCHGVTPIRRQQFRSNWRRSSSSEKVAQRASLRKNHQISNIGLQQQRKRAWKRKFDLRIFHTNFENSPRTGINVVRNNLTPTVEVLKTHTCRQTSKGMGY
ncbi:hypothetical protein B0H13DRAFT_1973093 [Mycena leptocephala]|nr:hypothetical protein B0H13DRAFT_1973093 [Mycena leptocephala]